MAEKKRTRKMGFSRENVSFELTQRGSTVYLKGKNFAALVLLLSLLFLLPLPLPLRLPLLLLLIKSLQALSVFQLFMHRAPRQSVCRNLKDLYENILRFIFKSKYWVECLYIDQNKCKLTASVVFCRPCG